MRKFPLALLCFSFFSSSLSAQFLTPQHSASLAPNVIFLEVGGNGGKRSLNYEQLVAHGEYLGAAARFGFGAFPGENRVREYGIPITVSGIVGAGNHKRGLESKVLEGSFTIGFRIHS